jgi:hypothetical protein
MIPHGIVKYQFHYTQLLIASHVAMYCFTSGKAQFSHMPENRNEISISFGKICHIFWAMKDRNLMAYSFLPSLGGSQEWLW